MLIERPEKPQGRDVTVLRHHLGINQTWFAALLETAQTSISLWEHVDKRDEYLPAPLSERFLEVWDCFPTKPAGGYTEAMATVAAYRLGRAVAAPRGPGEPPPGFVELRYPEGKAGPRVLIEETGQRPPGGQPLPPKVDAPAQEAAKLQGSGVNSAGTVQSNPSVSGRFALSFAMAASFAVFGLATGCLLSHRVPSEPPTQEPDRVPSELYTDGNGDMGTARHRSIPLPEKAYSWQKASPCEPGETEKVGGCWEKLDASRHPPCPDIAVESEGRCLVPIPAKPKKPNTITPEK